MKSKLKAEVRETLNKMEVCEPFWLKEELEGKSVKIEVLNHALQILKPQLKNFLDQVVDKAYSAGYEDYRRKSVRLTSIK